MISPYLVMCKYLLFSFQLQRCPWHFDQQLLVLSEKKRTVSRKRTGSNETGRENSLLEGLSLGVECID